MSHNITQDLNIQDVQNAFENSQFSVVYQAQVALANTNKIVGTEAYVRLSHPNYGLMVPSTFLSIVQDSGRMLELTKIVLEQIAQDWSNWKNQGFDLNISVNIDNSILSEMNLARELGKILSEFHIPKQQLTLEFTNCFKEDFLNEEIGKKLLGLRMKGYNLSLSDYGLNEIDLKAIEDLPLDEIKIDRQIIQNLLTKENNKAIARKAIRHAACYSMRVVAMGLESDKDAEWLARNGCDRAQGYLFGKPVEADEFTQKFLKVETTQISENKPITILIIEDDSQYQTLLQESLSEQYNTHVASTIQEAGDLFDRVNPEIIISDVYLPDGTGIDFCKSKIDANVMAGVSTIFISGGQDFDSKLEAYNAGGIDYIEKPFSIIELIAKIKQVATYQTRRHTLISDIGDAQSMAMQSLKDAAYYGDIVQFYKNLLHCRDEEQIARELFRFMAQKNLSTSIEFRSKNVCSNFDQLNGVCSAIEINLFELLQKNGRLFEFGKRIIVNDRHVSFLIKNMPDDETEHGRVRDYIAVLAEGMEARYRDILRQRVLNTVTQQLQELAYKLLESVKEDQAVKNEIMERFSLDLQMSFHVLDLSDPQEKHITEIIDEMLISKENAEHSTSDISSEINLILDSMSESLSGFDDDTQDVPPDNAGDSVELF